MRKRLLQALAENDDLRPVRRHRFVVYIMGPYKTVQVADLIDDPDSQSDTQFLEWLEDESEYSEQDVKNLLQRVRNRIRDGAELNAFLAIDADIPLEEMNAARQSLAFAHASNMIVFIAPSVGKNLGVGIEVGSILQSLTPESQEQERVLFIHEESVSSAMIRSLGVEWDVTVLSYADEDELVRKIRTFAMDILAAEGRGDLPSRDEMNRN